MNGISSDFETNILFFFMNCFQIVHKNLFCILLYFQMFIISIILINVNIFLSFYMTKKKKNTIKCITLKEQKYIKKNKKYSNISIHTCLLYDKSTSEHLKI